MCTGLSENVERQIAESLFDMILYGIDGGRGIGRDGSTRLHLAARRGKIIEFQGFDRYVFKLFSLVGNLKNVLAEIEDGEDVDVTDLLGNTPLHEATLNGTVKKNKFGKKLFILFELIITLNRFENIHRQCKRC